MLAPEDEMSEMLFVNLPVADLARARAWYEALGWTNNPQFTDETAACMVWSEAIFVMLLTHEKWASFTKKPRVDAHAAGEVMLALALPSKDEVHRLADTAGRLGGKTDVNPVQDLGFMVNRAVEDPDGHTWELMWMDPTVPQ